MGLHTVGFKRLNQRIYVSPQHIDHTYCMRHYNLIQRDLHWHVAAAQRQLHDWLLIVTFKGTKAAT